MEQLCLSMEVGLRGSRSIVVNRVRIGCALVATIPNLVSLISS